MLDWYYSDGRSMGGPVSDETMLELQRIGVIRPETAVWHAGFVNWVPYSIAMQPLGAVPPPPPLGALLCSECGRPYAPEDLARFGERAVCIQCKDAFVQKIREGVAPQGARIYAGFWIRFLAHFIDGIILAVVTVLVNALSIGAALMGRVGPAASLGITAGSTLLQYAIAASYEAFFVCRLGATPGKMAVQLKVTMSDGRPVPLGRAFGRYFAKLLSLFTLGIGYIIAAFDDEKRALHDHICDTRVVRAYR